MKKSLFEHLLAKCKQRSQSVKEGDIIVIYSYLDHHVNIYLAIETAASHDFVRCRGLHLDKNGTISPLRPQDKINSEIYLVDTKQQNWVFINGKLKIVCKGLFV